MSYVAWGINDRGQLAAGFYGPPEQPVNCVHFSEAVQVGGSYLGFSAALFADGTMRCLGGGVNGEMGQGGHRGSYYLPVTPQISGVRAFACAGADIVALTNHGTVAGWGGNSFGTLGNGVSGHGHEEGGSAYPVFAPVTNVKAIATSNGIVAALHDDGTVSTWGDGSCGALGIGRLIPTASSEGATPHSVPISGVRAVACGGFQSNNHVLALMEDGTVYQWGAKGPCGTAKDLLSPTLVPNLTNIVYVAAGPAQSFAIDAWGNLFAWGANLLGQLFLPATVVKQALPVKVAEGIRQVSCGFQYSLGLTVAGEVFGAGRNDHGQLNGVGLTGVEHIVACEHHGFAVGPTAVNPVASQKVAGGLEVSWVSPPTEHRWEVTPTVLGHLQGKQLLLDPSTRSVLIPALPGSTMAVKVRAGAAWPARTVVALA